MANQQRDISIDEAKAKQWIDDVKYEIKQTSLLLDKVAAANTSFPDDEDTILKTIKTIGNKMQSAWSSLSNAFTRVNETISTVIDSLGKGGNDVLSLLDELKRKIQ